MGKRPYVIAFGCYILGEVWIRLGDIAFWLTGFILTLVLLLKYRKCGIVLFTVVYIAGGFLYMNAVSYDSSMKETTNLTVQGTVSEITKGTENDKICLENCILFLHQKRIILKDKIMGFGEEEEFHLGDTVLLDGSLMPLEHPSNPGEFDSFSYYRSQKIAYTFVIKKVRSKKHSSHMIWKFKEKLRKIRNYLEKIYDVILTPKEAGICKAMVLGEKSGLDPDIKKQYQQNGIAHILAISGLHIAFWGAGLFRILRKTVGYYVPCAVCSAGLVFAYSELTGMSGSTKRAMLMLFVSFFGQVMGKAYDLLSAMSFAGLGILVDNPLQINQCGFLLSFGAVFAIGFVWELIQKNIKIKNKIISSFLVSISINIITFPVILYFYYEFPLYSCILNLLVVPCMSALLLFACVGGLVGIYSLEIAQVMMVPVKVILKFYERLCNITSKLPGADIVIGKPSVLAIAIYFILVGCGLFLLNSKKKKSCLLLLCMSVIAFLPYDNSKYVTMMDVGQGDCIFMKTGRNDAFLFDGGSSTKKDIFKYTMEPFLKSKGVAKLKGIFISHFDEDHINGIAELFEEKYPVDILYLPNTKDESGEKDKFVRLARENKTKVVYLSEGMKVTYQGEKIEFYCRYPFANSEVENKNESSMILDAKYGQKEILLTGDMEGAAEEEMIKQYAVEDKKPDILKVAHHGSKNSTTDDFLENVSADIALVSAGKRNRYGHPHKETISRLKKHQIPIATTIDNGAIMVRINQRKLIVQKDR